jgi:hypothetical protein
MPTLKLKKLFCQVPEDPVTDEAFLVVNGQKIWGPARMIAGQGRSVNQQINFTNFVDIKLFDEDDIFDSDDYLGTITVTNESKGKGEQAGKFTRDEANYTLYYEVV